MYVLAVYLIWLGQCILVSTVFYWPSFKKVVQVLNDRYFKGAREVLCMFVTHYTVIHSVNSCGEEIEKINNWFSLASNFQGKIEKQTTFFKMKFSAIAQTRD